MRTPGGATESYRVKLTFQAVESLSDEVGSTTGMADTCGS